MNSKPPFLLFLALSALLITNAQGVVYSIDINDANFPGETEPGWTALPATHTGNGGTVNVNGLDFTIASSDGARLRGGVGAPDPNPLTGDFAFDDGVGQAIILFFGGAGDLPAGDWQVELWTFDSGSSLGDQIVGYRTNNAETIVQSDVAVSSDNITPAITFSFNSDGSSAYDVFIRENNAENRSRLNAVRLTRLGARDVQLAPGGISSAIGASEGLSTLTPTAFPLSASYTYTLVAGDGDTHNSEFSISGDQLETSASYPGHAGGEILSIRIKAVDAELGEYEGVITIPVLEDSDFDGLDDDWELLYFNDLTVATGGGNDDTDRYTNFQEYLAGTDPTLADTDDDGIEDDYETNDGNFIDEFSTGTDPNSDDTDEDGVEDGDEIFKDLTNPLRDDTDEDGLKDGAEKSGGTDPLLADTDGDGFSDGEETTNATNPLDRASPASSGFLSAYWPLDIVDDNEGVLTTPDLAGSSYDLGLQNMDAATFVSEEGRQAVSFNGIDQLLQRLHDPGDDLPINKHSGFTISLWIKSEGTGQSDLRFFSEGSTLDTRPLFNLGTHYTGLDGRVNLYTRNSLSGTPQLTNGFPLDNTWRHFALTSNAHNGTVSFYLDGVLDHDDLVWRDLRTSLNVTSIGGIVRATPSHWFNGFIDDVSLWKKSLAEEEILALSTGTSPLALGGPESIVVVGDYDSEDSTINLTWNSKDGRNYVIRYSDDLSGEVSTWSILNANVSSGGGTTSYTDSTGPLPAKRFYVVEESP